jgi:hypothetical protein
VALQDHLTGKNTDITVSKGKCSNMAIVEHELWGLHEGEGGDISCSTMFLSLCFTKHHMDRFFAVLTIYRFGM